MHLVSTNTAVSNGPNQPKKNEFSNRTMFENIMRGILEGVSEKMLNKFNRILEVARTIGIESAVEARNRSYNECRNEWAGNQVNRTDKDISEIAQYVQKNEIDSRDAEKLIIADEIMIRNSSASADSTLHTMWGLIKQIGVSKLKELSVEDLVAISKDIVENSPDFCPKTMRKIGKRRLKEGKYDSIVTMKEARIELQAKESAEAQKESEKLEAMQIPVVLELRLDGGATQKFDDYPPSSFGTALLTNLAVTNSQMEITETKIPYLGLVATNSQERATADNTVQLTAADLAANSRINRGQPLAEGIHTAASAISEKIESTRANTVAQQGRPNLYLVKNTPEETDDKAKAVRGVTEKAKGKTAYVTSTTPDKATSPDEDATTRNEDRKRKQDRIKRWTSKKIQQKKKDEEERGRDDKSDKTERKKTKARKRKAGEAKAKKKQRYEERKKAAKEKEAKARAKLKAKKKKADEKKKAQARKEKERKKQKAKKEMDKKKRSREIAKGKARKKAKERPELARKKLARQKKKEKAQAKKLEKAEAKKKEIAKQRKQKRIGKMEKLAKQKMEKQQRKAAIEAKREQKKKTTAKRPEKVKGRSKKKGIHPLILAEIIGRVRKRRIRKNPMKMAA